MSRLRELELKQRIGWITDCLERHLPADFERAVNLILGSLPAPCDPYRSDGDFGDFIYAPYGEYVARHGCTRERPPLSLWALHEVTTRFFAEFAIRPFIGAFPDETREVLTDWTDDRHYHVRRLCSEGTRPRLPWATKLATGTDYALPLLERLHADPTRYVTRSVANHVNDISKIDPDLAIHTLERWRSMGRQSAAEMDYIVGHAARTLLRSGDARALGLLGISARPRGSISDG